MLHVERDILLGLTAKQFRRWERYYEVVPPETEKQDWRFASILQMLHLVNKSKDSQVIPLKDFLLKWEVEEKKPKTRDQILAEQWTKLNILAAMQAGDVSSAPKVIILGPDGNVVSTEGTAAPKGLVDGPGEVGPLPSNLVLPPELKAKVDAAMKRT